MRKVTCVIAVLLVIGASALAAVDDDAALLKRIGGYRQWTRVTPEPVKVEVAVTPANLASTAL